jgi:hypothetical protein
MSDIINLDTISLGDDDTKSLSFGGAEMLMNSSKTTKTKTTGDINISDLTKLEDELNVLSGRNSKVGEDDMFNKPIELNVDDTINITKTENSNEKQEDSNKKSGGFFSSFLYGNKDNASEVKKIDTSTENTSGVNENIRLDNLNSTLKPQKTFDDFSSFNDVPINPDKTTFKKPLSREETLKKKFEILRKLEGIEKKGAKLSKKYNMDSSLEEMEGEYEMLISEKEKKNSVKFQGKVMMALLTGIEFLNNRFDPFDLKLDGWAESVNENIDDYDEIFEELHEKYRSKAKMSPELKLLFQLGGSAVMLHMTNTMFKSAMPGMDDIMRQNPQLAQQFQQAAVSSMSQQNPNFGNFMNDMMSQQQQQQTPHRPVPPPSGPSGGPPPPQKTSVSGRYGDNQSGPMSMPSRPEFVPRSSGPPPPQKTKSFDDAVDMDMPFSSPNGSSKRPEMKGPSNINDLLSKIKRKPNMVDASQSARPRQSGLDSVTELKNVTLGETAPKTPRQRMNRSSKSRGDNNSTISIDELMSITKDADNLPRKSRRKPRSAKNKNTVSLDI